MYLPAFFKNSLLLVLCVSILASCSKDEPIIIDESKEITELSEISSPMKELVAMEMDDTENNTTKTCFDIVFPVELIFADETKQAIESFEDLTKAFRTWYEENRGKEDEEPSLNYPVKINLKDGTVKELQSDKELVVLLISCRDKEEGVEGVWNEDKAGQKGCFEINFPVTVIFSDRTSQVINNQEEYKDAINDKEKGKLFFEFPIEVTFEEGRSFEVKSEEELNDLYKACKEDLEEEDDKDSWNNFNLMGGFEGCFTVSYPVNLILNDGTERTVDSHEEIIEWTKSDDFQKFTFQFPVDLTLIKEEKAITINSEEELVRIYKYCKDELDEDKDEDREDWEDKDEDHEGWGDWDNWDKELELTSLFSDCFEVNYPITLILEDGATQTINSKEEAIELLRSNDKSSFVFEFPINITIEDEVKEIASLEELLETVLKTCIDIFHDWEDDRDDWEHDDRDDEIEWTEGIKGLISDCFQLNYPVTLMLDNGTTKEINSQDEIFEYIRSFDRQVFTFQFPINITLEDEESKEINNQEELIEIYKACFEDFREWGDDDREDWVEVDWDDFDWDNEELNFDFFEDCFKINYPISVSFEGRGDIAINNNDEFKQIVVLIFRNIFNDDDLENSEINYPFNVTLNNGSTETLNSDEDLWKVLSNCQ